MASKSKEWKREAHHKVINLLDDDALISVRGIASILGVSNGAPYYCLKALVEKSFVKFKSFEHSRVKASYTLDHMLWKIRAKAALTVQLLERKWLKCNNLNAEIEQLKNELSSTEKAFFENEGRTF